MKYETLWLLRWRFIIRNFVCLHQTKCVKELQGVYVKSLHFLNKVFSVFLLNKMLLNMTLLLQNFARIQNMPIFWSCDHHRMRKSSLINIRRILLWRTQNPTITSYLLNLRSYSIIWMFARPKPTICTKNNSTILKVVLRP